MYSIVEDGGIYFISHPFNEHYVKIGCGRFFVNRFKKALTWFPEGINVRLLLPSKAHDLRSLEAVFHHRYHKYVEEREWFHVTVHLEKDMQESRRSGDFLEFIYESGKNSSFISETAESFLDTHCVPVKPSILSLPTSNIRMPSQREHSVLLDLLTGATNSEISEALSISMETIKTHTSNLLSKFDCKNRTQLIVKAIRFGYV